MNSINKSVSQVVNAFRANIKSSKLLLNCVEEIKRLQRRDVRSQSRARAHTPLHYYFTENKHNFNSSLNRETQVCLNIKWCLVLKRC